jgi:DNA-directed RNA polymerase specialized sigma24 family protein
MPPISYNDVKAMMSCHEIPEYEWEHVHQALKYYFSRRLGLDNAEELAQETILRVWSRPDLEFETLDDFARLCFGFARYVYLEKCRERAQESTTELGFNVLAPESYVGSPRGTEAAVMLREVLEVGRAQLNEKEWRLLQNASDREMLDASMGPAKGKDRIGLYRVRKKLARLVGWSKGSRVTTDENEP